MKFVYGALLLIASITPTTFIGLKLYKYAPNKYIAAFSTTDGIKIANAAMQQAIIDIACGISVNITPQKDRAISQGNSPRGQYSDEAQRGQRICG